MVTFKAQFSMLRLQYVAVLTLEVLCAADSKGPENSAAPLLAKQCRWRAQRSVWNV
jgi:hypothetical protein